MDEEEPKNVGMVTCVCFVKRGVAKSIPDKVQLSENELKELIKKTEADIRSQDEDSDEDMEEQNENINRDDEFNFSNYDNEEVDPSKILGISSIATFSNNPSEDVNINMNEPDSDDEDDIIKPSDNLILVGHVQGDASVLEVYVHNEEEGSLYVHHDVLLPSFPLCIEWLDKDPSDNRPGNLCAIGSMDPIIQVWDLDIMNCLEPAFKLGTKANKKKRIRRVGHKDAVLTLAWNNNLDHILASGSADKTVLLWDLDEGSAHTKLKVFEDNIQSIQWHPLESQSLLTGCCDGKTRVFDCRSDDTFKTWSCEKEIEKVCWNPIKPFCFAIGTIDGHIIYYDCRQDTPIWDLDAHEGEISGLSLSSKCPGLLVTTSDEGNMKIWDIDESFPVLVGEKALAIGKTQCLSVCPENSFVYAAGGDFKAKNFGVWNIKKLNTVESCFNMRQNNDSMEV